MESKGTLIDVSRDWKTGKMRLTFEFDSDVSAAIDKIKDKLLRITVKLWRDKRSLDANSYYWVLLSKLAEKMEASKPEMHNQMLRDYGYDFNVDGLRYLVAPDTEAEEKRLKREEHFHVRPTSEVKAGADGKNYRTYILLEGSSTYDTKQMSRLIEGLISECKEQGIETLTPDELARMMKDYEENHKKKTV